MGYKKKVYEFDIEGNLINTYDSASKASKETNIIRRNIYKSISHGSYSNNKSYFSHDINFKPALRQRNHNPLLRKSQRGSNINLFKNIQQYFFEEQFVY